jgi:hypothetical protein
VASSPDRPFVPHRTPKIARPATSSSEFRLSRPFVPGRERDNVETLHRGPSGGARPESTASLQPIEDYFHPSAGHAPPAVPESNGEEFSSELYDESGELPPVEHFLDPLPPVGHFGPEGANPFDEAPAPGYEVPGATVAQSSTLASEWASTDWQQYDWRSIAALGESGESAASNAWATTDWGGSKTRANDERPTAAQAIASALDQIAQRIRDGEMAVPLPGSGTDPATIAATLAALLGIRT